MSTLLGYLCAGAWLALVGLLFVAAVVGAIDEDRRRDARRWLL